jgi:hypothetical protein
MTTQTTAEAAHTAGVTTATIRAWCRRGAVTARKVSGRWAIDTDSLRHRIALGRQTVPAQLAAFADPKTARIKAEELVELGALIALDSWRYLAVGSNGKDGYVVDTLAGSCTCKGYVYVGRCHHAVAAVMLDSRTTAQLALAA